MIVQIVCLHGISSFSFVWEPLNETVMQEGHRYILTFEFYGRGVSSSPNVKVDENLL